MLHIIRSTIASALFLIALGGALCAAPLAYKIPAGTQFELTSVTDTELPIVGPKHATLKALVKVEAAGPDGMTLQQSIVSSIPGKPDLAFSLGAKLSPQGRISDITGVDLNNPKFALVAKNAAMALPPLPDEEVSVGMTWEDEKPLYLPKLPIPGVPETVRLHTSYRVTGISKQGGRELVTIEMVMKESGGKVKVNASGSFTVEAGTGKPVFSHLQGEASLRVIIKTFKVPFKTDITVR